MSRIGGRPVDAPDLPGGHITFLFTDLEDSSAAWERRPDDTRLALQYHDAVAEETVNGHGGVLIKHTGDGIKSVFTSGADAVKAALAMQNRFQQEQWDGVPRMRVRIGLHAGESTPDGDDYYGGVINRAARVADIANGDQIAVTQAVLTAVEATSATEDMSAADIEPTDCGLVNLKGCGRERIFLLTADGLIKDERPLRVRRALAESALPAEVGRLVGRGDETRRLTEFLAARRLTTVVGLGGFGKTRLAVAVARRTGDNFAEGVVYCPLGPITTGSADPYASVVAAVAQALGARRQPGHDLLASIVSFIEGRELLVVLDNCEHVNAAVRSIVERLLSVDGPTILATSREPLDIPGEQRLNLEPLATDSDAVELLVERVVERDPAFDQAHHIAALQEISRRLDGIPLALELAAARLRILAPERLLEGLHEGLALLGSSASSPAGGLHATVAWSVDQLDNRQQSVLEGLCVFSGGFTLDAAAAVLQVDDELSLLDDLSYLVELSLIKNTPGQGDIRFTMLETIRQFGLGRLTERDPERRGELSNAHAMYYGELAADCGRNLMTSAEGEIWTRIDSNGDNIRAAFEHLVQTVQYDSASEIVVDLSWFSMFSMRMERFAWTQQLLEIPELAERADLWAVRAIGQYLSADDEAQRSAERSLELDPSDPTGLAQTALASVGLNNTFDAELSGRATAAMLEQPSDRFREKQIAGLGLRSFHLCLLEPNAKAVEMARQTLEVAQETGSASALTIAYWAQTVANLLIDPPTAEASTRRGLAMAESLTNNHLISHLINGLVVHFAALAGPVAEAASTTATEIRATMDRHYLVGASHLLGAASVVLCRAGRLDDAAGLLGSMIGNGHRPRREVRATVEAALGDDASVALRSGQGWSINEAGQHAVLWLDEVATAEDNG